MQECREKHDLLRSNAFRVSGPYNRTKQFKTNNNKTDEKEEKKKKEDLYLWVCLADVDQKLVHQSADQTARGVNAGNELWDHLQTNTINITIIAANSFTTPKLVKSKPSFCTHC
jgi:hypothetical protein